MIKTDDSSIADILTKSGVVYSIPSYQRGFDWGKQELQELIEDLEDSINTNKKLYLGSLIFDVSDDRASVTNEYKVVDGQQRMTTMSITLVAVRYQFIQLNEHNLAGRVQRLLDDESVITGKGGRKLTVSENIREIYDYISDYDWLGDFPDKINGKSVKRQVNKIKPIFDYVYQTVKGYNSERLGQFYQTLLSSYVVVINVQSVDDVFAIFERTNARGLDLNIGDLLKNYILSKDSERLYEEEWGEIVNNAAGSLQRMLKYFWVSRRGHTQSSQLYRNLKGYSAEVGIDMFVSELVEFSRFYLCTQALGKTEVRDWLYDFGLDKLAENQDTYEKIARVFHGLKQFRVTQAYPIIFSIFTLYKSDLESASSKQLINTLTAIEKYHFINNIIAGRIGNDVEKFYAEKSSELYMLNEKFNLAMDNFVSDLAKKKASKQEFIAKFNENLSYSSNNLGLIMYFFDRFNNYGAKGAQYIDIHNIDSLTKIKHYNIEHILPQSYVEMYDDVERELVDSIGNLLILPRHSNSGLGNMSFQDKIHVLEGDSKYRGKLAIIDDFVKQYQGASEWGIKEINQRVDNLSRMAYEHVWQL